ncbi:hypothetical protein RJ641_035083 [Dillenia turbinata]|uniref:Cyclic nucleotide-binding domain-containing protein n=1 Tax=Dillenia turbinata TaxID=194707 RepID=A0AAN8VH14_9MAGN
MIVVHVNGPIGTAAIQSGSPGALLRAPVPQFVELTNCENQKPHVLLIVQGGEGGCFYVVGGGAFEVLASEEEKNGVVPRVLYRYTAEKLSSFGELALILCEGSEALHAVKDNLRKLTMERTCPEDGSDLATIFQNEIDREGINIVLYFKLFEKKSSRLKFLVKATGESLESSTSLSIVKSVQTIWEELEDRSAFIGLGVAGLEPLRLKISIV